MILQNASGKTSFLSAGAPISHPLNSPGMRGQTHLVEWVDTIESVTRATKCMVHQGFNRGTNQMERKQLVAHA